MRATSREGRTAAQPVRTTAAQAVPPGSDMEWRIQLQNKSTQDRELLSIEMPQQAQRMFTLKEKMPTFERPIRLPPGGTHTQTIKFSNRGFGQQARTLRGPCATQ